MRRSLVCVALLSLILSTFAWSQEARGSIIGRVFDPTGAAVSGASVEVQNKAMGTKAIIKTNDTGHYQASFLIPGAYQVSITVPGFKKWMNDNIEVRINDRLEIDATLQLGDASQSVTVTEEAPMLNTTSGSLGTVIDSKRVSELPIVHGNTYSLIGLASGVSFTRDPRLDRPFEPTHIVGYAMDGTRANRSDVTVDGVPTTATANNGEVIASYVPPADVVQEFKVQTATFDASFGQTEGGVTNISVKSGANQMHGAAYYADMTPDMYANDFMANRVGIPIAKFDYLRWGGMISGPVVIPKVINGKNKFFWLFGIEGIDEARPRNNGTATVPTDKMKQGDFSDLLKVAGSYQIYNPFTRRAVAGGRYQQDPFPGNLIPSSLHNPVAKNVLTKYFPSPLQPGNADGSNNYQRPELTEDITYTSYTGRFDWNIGDNQRMFFRGNWYDRDSFYNDYFNNASTGQAFQFLSRGAVLDDVITLNSTTIINWRLGYNRFIRAQDGNPLANGFDLTTLGFPAAYNNMIPENLRRFPRFDLTGYQGTGFTGERRPNDLIAAIGAIQKSWNKHFVKAGVEFRSYRETDSFTSNDQTGRFNFDSAWTRGPLDNSPNSPGSLGQSVAAMLLGLPSASNSYVNDAANYAEQSTAYGVYVQDDWRVNNKLTINMGLRWEYETALTERYNRSVKGFDFDVVQPMQPQARINYAKAPTPEVPVDQFNVWGGLNFPGVGGESRGMFRTPTMNWMPRFGLAWKINEKTVFRGGYGMFFGFLGQRRMDVIQTGFSQQTAFIPSTDNGLTFINTLSNPFPTGMLVPQGSKAGIQTNLGNAVTFFSQDPQPPIMQRWQAGFQFEFGKSWMAEVNYVGNKGTQIEIAQNLNATPNVYLSTTNYRDNALNNYLTTNLANPFLGLMPAGATATFTNNVIVRERLLREYPEFDTVNWQNFNGYSWYHSMQVSLEKRFGKGLSFGANYTWSKFMQATELLNAGDYFPTRVISDQDRPHRLTVNGIYEMPFGRRKPWANNLNSVANGFVAGWQVSAIYTYQAGSPIGWGNIFYYGELSDIVLPESQRTVERWFNTDAPFVKAAAAQPVSNIRTFPLRFSGARGNGTNNWDVAITKNTFIHERYNIQLRGDFLNALNTPQFPNPNTTVTVSQFGQAIASNSANYARRIQFTLRFAF